MTETLDETQATANGALTGKDDARSGTHGRAAIRDLRLVAFLEGASYLVLLAIAMPLKYMAGMPEAVRIVGTIHGILFVLYVAAVARAGLMRRWPVRRWLENLAASLLPFGPFLIDARLRREQESIPRADVAAS